MNNINEKLPLNKLIKKYRLQKGISQTELAEAANVSQSLISKIEKSSDKSITFKNLVQIAKTLGFGFDEINLPAEIKEVEAQNIVQLQKASA
jgi:transcriptional regulator with XRE-family HTH domain